MYSKALNPKFQIPSSKASDWILEFEVWNFSGAWNLELGIFPLE
jgi:hypothetical protein